MPTGIHLLYTLCMSKVSVDTHIKEPELYNPKRRGMLAHLRKPYWNIFFEDRITEIFKAGGLIVDIGGGLRVAQSRGNRFIEKQKKVFEKYLSDPKVQYKVTDYTDKYSPDFVEDIHNLSFKDESIDGMLCIALLEHVYDPKKATEEIYRVLKKGGKAFLYAPFIYRYHAHSQDYRDYFRYSKDGWGYLLRNFSKVEVCPVRGLFESLLKFTPLYGVKPLKLLCRSLDFSCKKMREVSQRQTSGYNVYVEK